MVDLLYLQAWFDYARAVMSDEQLLATEDAKSMSGVKRERQVDARAGISRARGKNLRVTRVEGDKIDWALKFEDLKMRREFCSWRVCLCKDSGEEVLFQRNAKLSASVRSHQLQGRTTKAHLEDQNGGQRGTAI